MSKTPRFMLAILLLLALVLGAAACGDDDDKDDGDKSSLSETYTSETGVSFKYPKDWVVQDSTEGILLANSQEAIEADDMGKDQVGIVIMDPAMISLVTADTEMSSADVLAMFASMMSGETEGATVGETTETKVGNNAAARANISDDKSDGFVMVIELGDAKVLIFAAAGKDGLDKHEDTILKIAGTISYAAPAAPAATEDAAG